MNLDELKQLGKNTTGDWNLPQSLSERVITSMMRERSHSRISRAKRSYVASIGYMIIVLVFCVAVFLGNPFDFKHWYQYLVIGIYFVCSLIFLTIIIGFYLTIRRIDIARENLVEALRKIIAMYDKPQKIADRTGLVILIAAVLFPLSFLSRSIQTHGVWLGIALQLIPMGVSILLIFLAKKLGAFRDRFRESFRDDLKELEELKALSNELAGAA